MTGPGSPSEWVRRDPLRWTPDEGGFWALSIKTLDGILDRLEGQATTFYQSEFKTEAGDLRAAATTIRAVRDGLLVRQYDTNRKKDR